MKTFFFALAILMISTAAQASCSPNPSSPTVFQICNNTLTWVAPIVDSTHDIATSYVIQRKDGTGSFTDIQIALTGLNFVDTIYNDTGNLQHCYQVISVNSAGRDGPSNIACMTSPAIQLPPKLPNPPTGLTISSVSNSTINISWKDNSDNEIGFQAQISGPGYLSYPEFPINATMAQISRLKKNTSYAIAMRSLGNDGTSNWSDTVMTKTLK